MVPGICCLLGPHLDPGPQYHPCPQKCWWSSYLSTQLRFLKNHTKVFSDAVPAHLQSFLPQLQCMLCDLITGHIGGHDEDGILAVNGLPLPICQSSLGRNGDGMVRELQAWTGFSALSTHVLQNTPPEPCAAASHPDGQLFPTLGSLGIGLTAWLQCSLPWAASAPLRAPPGKTAPAHRHLRIPNYPWHPEVTLIPHPSHY